MTVTTKDPPLLEVVGLRKYFPVRGTLGRSGGQVFAVDGLRFRLGAAETLGLVGESGCGKSTAGKTILKRLGPSAGRVRLRRHDTSDPAPAGTRALALRRQ